MSYADARNQATRDAFKSVLNGLVAHYDPARPTVILLPGGMGSQLDRSNARYAGNPIDFKDFSTLWVSAGVLLRQAALGLAMDTADHDIDDYIIVPDGPIRFPFLAAYEGAQKYFADNSYNFAIAGYDWRRELQEAATNLHQFLRDFQTEITAKGLADPLPRTSLYCHSQGGLVARLYMSFPNSLASALQAVITIATPFYGTATHMQRYFAGDPTLNLIYERAKVAGIVGTLPGPYALMPMDHATWNARKDILGVAKYPVLDANGAIADPYDVANVGTRYPDWVDANYIEAARLARVAIDADLPAGILSKVFHLRSDYTPTYAHFQWPILPAHFNADTSPDPLVVAQNGSVGGDGTVPAFSARLAQSSDNHILTVPTTQLHQDLAENARVLQAVGLIIGTGAMPATASLTAPDRTYSQPAMASRGAVAQVLTAAGNKTLADGDPRLNAPDMQRAILREFLK
jgi:hypothetical protein